MIFDKPLHVAVLMGGWANERPVSLTSGAGVADALESKGHRVTRIDMGRDVALRLHEAKPDKLAADFLAALKARRLSVLADARWVFSQYDHQLFLNTVEGPGGDAAVLRLKHPTSGADTGRGIALTTDGNHRWCAVDPRQGTVLQLQIGGGAKAENFGAPINLALGALVLLGVIAHYL